MALTVNSNIPSLNAQRNLARSTIGLNKALERLSSGLRINRAGDDAAGLAISESLRSQIRGQNQAVRNASDGLSLIGTTESAIGAYTDLLQRLRELAVQSANDTNSAINRQALDAEAIQIVQEMTRIASTVEFNGTKLLDGTFTSKQLQVGANVNETMTINTGDLRTSIIGAVAQATGVSVTGAISNPGELIIEAVDVPNTTADGISTADDDSSAIAISRAINSISDQTGVTSTVEAATVTGIAAVSTVNLTDAGTNQLQINNVKIIANVTPSDGNETLRKAINAVTNQTGVTATVDAGGFVTLTAADGRNIEVHTVGGSSGMGDGTAFLLGLVDDATANMVDGVADGRGKVTVSSDDAFSVTGSAKANAGFGAITGVAIDVNTALNRTSIGTGAGANATIKTVDNALRQVNNVRSKLGAVTNRLEITIQNLQAIAENLAGSESRIRDADFALETAALSKNQILQQAGVAILAQANVTSQAALALLNQ